MAITDQGGRDSGRRNRDLLAGGVFETAEVFGQVKEEGSGYDGPGDGAGSPRTTMVRMMKETSMAKVVGVTTPS